MDPNEISKEQLKDIMHVMGLMAANIENWKYVSVNAEYMDKKRVADALEQMLSMFSPMISAMQGAIEVEALTKLDPYDLI